MSMHDIESVVESSIRCIDKSDFPLEKKRNFLYSLYKFQAEYDTGYTNFRVKDILLKYHYMFCLPVEVHPEYAKRKDEFDKWIKKGESKWIADSILEIENGKPLFYFEVGSDTWKGLVKNGILTGNQTLSVSEIPILEVILDVVKLCCDHDAECASEWFKAIILYLLWRVKEEDSAILDSISEILFNDANFSAAYEDSFFQSNMGELPEDFIEECNAPGIFRKWVNNYVDWQKKREGTQDFYIQEVIKMFTDQDFEEVCKICKKGLALFPDSSFLMLYEAIAHILILRTQRIDIQKCQYWLNRLEKLLSVQGEDETNTKQIKSHALYYTAYIYVMCNHKWDEAKKITEELIKNYQMKDAEELHRYILEVEKG